MKSAKEMKDITDKSIQKTNDLLDQKYQKEIESDWFINISKILERIITKSAKQGLNYVNIYEFRLSSINDKQRDSRFLKYLFTKYFNELGYKIIINIYNINYNSESIDISADFKISW